MKRTWPLAVLLASGLAALSGRARAGERPTVAVLDFKAHNTSSGDTAIVSQFVRTAMVKSRQFAVVDKNNMEKLLEEQVFQRTGCVSEACAVRIGKILNVRTVLVGTYGLLGDRRVMSVQLVDVETGRIRASESQRIPDVASAEESAEKLVRKLLMAPVPGVEEKVGSMAEERAMLQPGMQKAGRPPRQVSTAKWAVFGGALVGVFLLLVGAG